MVVQIKESIELFGSRAHNHVIEAREKGEVLPESQLFFVSESGVDVLRFIMENNLKIQSYNAVSFHRSLPSAGGFDLGDIIIKTALKKGDLTYQIHVDVAEVTTSLPAHFKEPGTLDDVALYIPQASEHLYTVDLFKHVVSSHVLRYTGADNIYGGTAVLRNYLNEKNGSMFREEEIIKSLVDIGKAMIDDSFQRKDLNKYVLELEKTVHVPSNKRSRPVSRGNFGPFTD